MDSGKKQFDKQFSNNANQSISHQSQSSQSNSYQQTPIQSLSDQSDSDQLSEESSPVEAAIKTMKFRKKRGSKMKDLLNGKIDNDAFWEKNCVFFGGNLKNREDDEDSQDYQQSSSGRDQFDSDFNLTDSYPGKRGRKKGSKVKKSKGRGRGRGRPKKRESSESEEEKDSESSSEKQKERQRSRSRSREKKKGVRKFRKVLGSADDEFIVFKAEPQKGHSKRGRKKKVVLTNQERKRGSRGEDGDYKQRVE